MLDDLKGDGVNRTYDLIGCSIPLDHFGSAFWGLLGCVRMMCLASEAGNRFLETSRSLRREVFVQGDRRGKLEEENKLLLV